MKVKQAKKIKHSVNPSFANFSVKALERNTSKRAMLFNKIRGFCQAHRFPKGELTLEKLIGAKYVDRRLFLKIKKDLSTIGLDYDYTTYPPKASKVTSCELAVA